MSLAISALKTPCFKSPKDSSFRITIQRLTVVHFKFLLLNFIECFRKRPRKLLRLKANPTSDKNYAHKFKETFVQSVEEEGYFRDDAYNVDETGVNWKALPGKSLA
ncbi:hypothetical protein TNCV_4620691 [Trichonephila clavipes]|nr:hypothetical protein TNCV_4620691 [Trichonephila clavipes]